MTSMAHGFMWMVVSYLRSGTSPVLRLTAFGMFARALPKTAEFESLHRYAAGLELADSITGDGHKMLNVVSIYLSQSESLCPVTPSAQQWLNLLQPYDCGFFFTRTLRHSFSAFQNANAVYLKSGPSNIPSPLNIGLENSRRFRALPVYAALVAHGAEGYSEIFASQVRLTRAVASFLHDSPGYDLLPASNQKEVDFANVHMIVMFRAKDSGLNEKLVKKINDQRKIYVSGTVWGGKPACRIAVSTWKVDVEQDARLIVEVLQSVLE